MSLVPTNESMFDNTPIGSDGEKYEEMIKNIERLLAVPTKSVVVSPENAARLRVTRNEAIDWLKELLKVAVEQKQNRGERLIIDGLLIPTSTSEREFMLQTNDLAVDKLLAFYHLVPDKWDPRVFYCESDELLSPLFPRRTLRIGSSFLCNPEDLEGKQGAFANMIDSLFPQQTILAFETASWQGITSMSDFPTIIINDESIETIYAFFFNFARAALGVAKPNLHFKRSVQHRTLSDFDGNFERFAAHYAQSFYPKTYHVLLFRWLNRNVETGNRLWHELVFTIPCRLLAVDLDRNKVVVETLAEDTAWKTQVVFEVEYRSCNVFATKPTKSLTFEDDDLRKWSILTGLERVKSAGRPTLAMSEDEIMSPFPSLYMSLPQIVRQLQNLHLLDEKDTKVVLHKLEIQETLKQITTIDPETEAKLIEKLIVPTSIESYHVGKLVRLETSSASSSLSWLNSVGPALMVQVNNPFVTLKLDTANYYSAKLFPSTVFAFSLVDTWTILRPATETTETITTTKKKEQEQEQEDKVNEKRGNKPGFLSQVIRGALSVLPFF